MKFKSFVKTKLGQEINLGTQDYGFINEASFSEGKLVKVSELYGKMLGRTLGGEFKVIGKERFKGQLGAGIGIRTMNNAGHQLRFNFDDKIAKYANKVLTSLSYWRPGTDFQKPDLVMVFHPDLNVVDVMDKIGKSFKASRLVESDQDPESEELVCISEARTSKELKAWLTSHDLPTYLSSPAYSDNLKNKVKKVGLQEQLELFLGSDEVNTFEKETLKTAEKALESVKYADPETIFQDMEELLKVVATRQWKSLAIMGGPGLGKCASFETEINFKGL